MATQKTYFIVQVLNYYPRVGHALSEKDGWFVGPSRFCGLSKARRFELRAEAAEYLEDRYKDKGFEFEIVEVREWVD